MIRNDDAYTDDFLSLRKKFRECFSSENNLEVLFHLLSDMGTFEEVPTDPGSIALRNYGVRLLEIIGPYDEGIIKDVLRSFIKLPFAPNIPPQEE